MSYHFISCHFISFHVISFHFISFHFISYHFISRHFISCHIISYHFISYHFISISFHFMSCHIISFHVISYHFRSFHFISCHIISFHIISCHFISFHVLQPRSKESWKQPFPGTVIDTIGTCTGQCDGIGQPTRAPLSWAWVWHHHKKFFMSLWCCSAMTCYDSRVSRKIATLWMQRLTMKLWKERTDKKHPHQPRLGTKVLKSQASEVLTGLEHCNATIGRYIKNKMYVMQIRYVLWCGKKVPPCPTWENQHGFYHDWTSTTRWQQVRLLQKGPRSTANGAGNTGETTSKGSKLRVISYVHSLMAPYLICPGD